MPLHYEMNWDCKYCGTTRLLGKSHRHCPTCGAAQDPQSRYFPPEEDKVAVEDHVFEGTDWVCERCDSPNSLAAEHCINCGDLRDGAESEAAKVPDAEAGTQSGMRSSLAASREPDLPEVPAPSGRSTWKRVVGIGLLVVVAVIVIMTWKTSTTATVTAHSWEREVRIERFQSVRDSSWCDSMPAGAYGSSRSRKERSTRKVADGETCKTVNVDDGDGTFHTKEECSPRYRSEPVYDDWCTFTVDRWKHDRTATAQGSHLTPAPSWPGFQVTDCRQLNCTREASRRGVYTVELTDGEGTVDTCEFDQERWASMALGSTWTASKQVLVSNLVCDSLVADGSP